MHRLVGVILAFGLFATAGCAINLARRSPWDIQQLEELSGQLEEFKTLARMKADEADELRRAQGLLESRLGSANVSVGYDERGLVTRLLDQVLFGSGKAKLRFFSRGVLDRVAKVLQEVPAQPVGIEGHTDDVPIKHSGWASNRDLSYARASAVVDYLVEKHGIDSSRLTAIGYGEDRPIAPNDTLEGRQKNRRVEIIILPQASGKAYSAEADRQAQRGSGLYSK